MVSRGRSSPSGIPVSPEISVSEWLKDNERLLGARSSYQRVHEFGPAGGCWLALGRLTDHETTFRGT
jgi:hypothetical protein